MGDFNEVIRKHDNEEQFLDRIEGGGKKDTPNIMLAVKVGDEEKQRLKVGAVGREQSED